MFRLVRTKEIREIRDAAKAFEAKLQRAEARADGAESKLAERRSAPVQCSFCRKSSEEVSKIIAGPAVFICDECTELCMQIILEGRAKAREAK